MKTETLKSGLVIPEQPKKPTKQRPILEVQDDATREQVAEIIGQLVTVLDFKRGTSGLRMVLPESVARPAHAGAVLYLAEMLLGDDFRGWAEYT